VVDDVLYDDFDAARDHPILKWWMHELHDDGECKTILPLYLLLSSYYLRWPRVVVKFLGMRSWEGSFLGT
jgi:hypothetical protein